MRLTKLKLAGFKSFVDPTMVALPGQLVGVVGPNGCGKSNIMDAVRWVLGESKASELRGESMQDVIFNGSSNRKPVSRASVELIFDNSLGRAMGQWSQYAELSVKRVLTRAGQSDYLINNIKVRRKDITDLFLGTGLGPRAYAIIGQGMISRIIEAKPDELRVFLEEAAGVTRYKERRKETEGRLADTRENLLRVEDIRLELGGQMERLEAQAAVARQYHQLNDELTLKQQVLWVLRRNEAKAEQQRFALEIERAGTDLEGQTAILRETEAQLEASREAHFAASDGVHQAQSDLFTVNADVARLETEIRHQRESRLQLESRIAQLEGEQQHWQEQGENLDMEEERWRELQLVAEARLEQAQMKLEARQERLPMAEEAQAAAQEALNQQRNEMAKVEQVLQVEQTHRSHAQRTLQTIAQRRDRMEQERDSLAEPDTSELDLKTEELEEQKERLIALQDKLGAAQGELPQLESRRRDLLNEVQQAMKDVADVRARRAALEQLQARVQSGGKVGEWLRRHGLEGRTPLWKRLHVEAGWEDAVEAVLRERLNAVAAEDPTALAALVADKPAGKLTLLLSGAAPVASGGLLARIRCDEPTLAGVIADWLHGVDGVDNLEAALPRRESLAPGQSLVTREGHLVTRHSLTLFAPDSTEHGLLERQREIESLASVLEDKQLAVETVQAQLAEVEARITDLQADSQNLRRRTQEQQDRIHTLQMEVLRQNQILDRIRERHAQIEQAATELAAEEEVEQERLFMADEAIAVQREILDELHARFAGVRARLEEADRALREEREALAGVEREQREAQFALRECQSKLAEMANNRTMSQRQQNRIQEDLAQCRENYDNLQVEILEPRLQEALEMRVLREQALAHQREALENATQALRHLEEQRLKVEQGLNPMRDRVGELRLKEQAAALNVEQLTAQLLEAGANEEILAEQAQAFAGTKASTLQGSIGSLQKAILELGAVNLAALEELEAAKQRKEFLDAQADDLNTAMETLENAIRRIDKETRDLLQATYDTVNRHFGELFPTLFGGGEARLVMTGDEILDSGVQIIAQPPGKKNATIHLLSGGEKALTAIALVFAMFQLNPAPFCLLDEVDAPLDDSNTERFADMVKRMSSNTQFLFISHNKIAMEMAQQLVGVTMQESGVSRVVEVDIAEALRMREQVAA
ncbi:chromosome partition protein Smc [Azospira sp. I13]|uniref:chromosome segregation protein SMC n=1 Tax=Azospira sp. I13 TaxID=1765050 RepID=UPI000D467F27|nr:chromosome segregation protein SMC [Azospira sp. I13]GBG01858.1 chromosome partition protein Smc [Azospira sp. I13]